MPRDARLLVWVGASPDYSDERNPVERPCEPEAEGCPGGWARCAFAASLTKYTRRLLDNGGHDMNPIIGPDTEPHILDALRSYEAFEAVAAGEQRRRVRDG